MTCHRIRRFLQSAEKFIETKIGLANITTNRRSVTSEIIDLDCIPPPFSLLYLNANLCVNIKHSSMLLASIYICTKRILYDASIGRHFKLNNMHLFGFCISLVNVSEDVQIKFFYRFNQRLELHFQRTVPILSHNAGEDNQRRWRQRRRRMMLIENSKNSRSSMKLIK